MGWAPFIWVGLVSCMMLGLGLAFILVPRFPWDQFFDNISPKQLMAPRKAQAQPEQLSSQSCGQSTPPMRRR
ncbi:hypothetical protein FPOAC1_003642 [Fusarium poae]|uniref:hypothetical protein n=1 Tax=Fusarium poae TaxID=36050 RepID=UPI001CE8F63B|nr:hypothetical protein FPOAC1_003642 [Fusarium poae]KAG8677618.1 hypothetical protein FPOAC1_003642 [Fusarium poae]